MNKESQDNKYILFSRWTPSVLFCVLVFMLCLASTTSLLSGCPQPVEETVSPKDASSVWVDETPIQPTPDTSNKDDEITDFSGPLVPLTFASISVFKGKPLQKIVFLGDNAVAAGEGFFFSNDLGATWKETSPQPWVGYIQDLAVHPDRKTILAVGGTSSAPYNGLILLSEDSGENWRAIQVFKAENPNEDKRLRSAVWLTNILALAVGVNGQLYRSIDSGKTWTPVNTLPENSKTTNWNIMRTLNTDIFLGGADSTLLYSPDNATSWEVRQREEGGPAFLDLYFLDKFEGIAVGEDNLAYTTRNAGREWNKLRFDSFPDEEKLHTITGDGQNIYIALSPRSFWISRNRGKFWRNYTIFASELPPKYEITGAAFQNAQTVFFTTTFGTLLRGSFQQ